jgi:hypothetical protein
MPETSTISAITATNSTTVSATIGPVRESNSMAQVFNNTSGYFVSDPMILVGNPIKASMVRWTVVLPPGVSLLVETSINFGASWDTATNNRPVPRLLAGDTATRYVQIRATLTGPSLGVTPRLKYLSVSISTDVGTLEYVPIGHALITKVTSVSTGGSTGGGASSGNGGSGVTSVGGGQTGGGTTVKIHCVDLAQSITRNKWRQQYTVPSGIPYSDAMVAMVQDRRPQQSLWLVTPTPTTLVPESVIFGGQDQSDPWQDFRKFASACGFECFFGNRGEFVFQPVPDPRYGIPVYKFTTSLNPVVTEAQKELSDEQTINWVVVKGQSTSSTNAVQAEAFDDDPSSRTYILGDWGIASDVVTFPLAQTTDQCQQIANSILYNSLGGAETVTITHVPVPFLMPGDVIEVDVPNVQASGTYMIQTTAISASSAAAQTTTVFRQSTNTAITPLQLTA